MVTVAKSFDAPIKLLFPRTLAAARAAAGAASSAPAPFSMLGLGDIVIPGVFVALLLRRDAAAGKRGARGAPRAGARPLFPAAFGGYVAGLAATIVVMVAFDAAQPALLYIVPAVLGATAAAAAVDGDAKGVWEWSEEPEAEKKKV